MFCKGAYVNGEIPPMFRGTFLEPRVRIPPVEDMIADRLGQFELSERRDGEMLN